MARGSTPLRDPLRRGSDWNKPRAPLAEFRAQTSIKPLAELTD
jgi:hypothetical protein